jgi:hypothetical protein
VWRADQAHITPIRKKPLNLPDLFGKSEKFGPAPTSAITVNEDLTLVCYALLSCPSRLEIAGTVSTNIEYACITHGVIENEVGLS